MQGKILALALALCAIAGLALGMGILFAGGPPPAPSRPRILSSPLEGDAELAYSPTHYRALVERDARAMGVEAPTAAELAAPFPYFDELPSSRKLRVGGTVRTARLAVSLVVRREEGAVEGQSFRADHLVLQIQNLTGHYLAYRVATLVPDVGRCEPKGVIAHDAIALRPHETIRRTECLFHGSREIELTRVEVLEIPPLSYLYVSRLLPSAVLYDVRTAEGHVIPRGKMCPPAVSWRDVRDGAAHGEIDWRDLIDFYARHNCDELAFFPGYRYRVDAGAPLPARPTRNRP